MDGERKEMKRKMKGDEEEDEDEEDVEDEDEENEEGKLKWKSRLHPILLHSGFKWLELGSCSAQLDSTLCNDSIQ
ncbi:hypothetical protein JCGZ_01878 [Jatropha curcas]|uniref:Uncharacterized protein n=1 Tax=Jatropha curcas TaxID=180498 RepID=A0A067LC72_JATCU|nr:hypothetical protein JCGZ_01878 [Jatropha curcas]